MKKATGAHNYLLVGYKTMWIMEDISNSSKSKGSYIWIFNTRKEALEHRREQHKMKFGATLSKPERIKLRGQFVRIKLSKHR